MSVPKRGCNYLSIAIRQQEGHADSSRQIVFLREACRYVCILEGALLEEAELKYRIMFFLLKTSCFRFPSELPFVFFPVPPRLMLVQEHFSVLRGHSLMSRGSCRCPSCVCACCGGDCAGVQRFFRVLRCILPDMYALARNCYWSVIGWSALCRMMEKNDGALVRLLKTYVESVPDVQPAVPVF